MIVEVASSGIKADKLLQKIASSLTKKKRFNVQTVYIKILAGEINSSPKQPFARNIQLQSFSLCYVHL